LDETEIKRLIAKVLELGHFSVLEHASFTFAIEGISRACSHQLVRHRIASFSQQSQRYVKMTEFEFPLPPSIEQNETLVKQFHQAMSEAQKYYSAFIDAGIPAEDARYVLPNATETKLIMTANARSLLNFFELRLCTRAQWEIRNLAQLMLQEVRRVAPNIFSTAGPTCESKGYCSEGTMGCGKAKPLRIPEDTERQ
jgi:thymidylate synthase (FAD)